MKKLIITLVAASVAVSAYTATVSTGKTAGRWESTDLQTMLPDAANIAYNLTQDDTEGVFQTFTATEDMTVESISILAQRMEVGATFGFDIWELFNGDGRSPQAHPERIRIGLIDWSTLVAAFTVNSPVAIKTGGCGENMLTVAFRPQERFVLEAGHTYALHIYSKMPPGSPPIRMLVWSYADGDVYDGGTFGYKRAIAARDFGLAVTGVPKPKPAPATPAKVEPVG